MQRPELWSLYNGRIHAGEHMRIFPLSNWTELDIWHYIHREQIEIPSIYFAHEREVIRARRHAALARDAVQPKGDGEVVESKMVRFRTVRRQSRRPGASSPSPPTPPPSSTRSPSPG